MTMTDLTQSSAQSKVDSGKRANAPAGTLTATLPLPPSINATNKRRDYKAEAIARQWRSDALIRLRMQGWRRLPTRSQWALSWTYFGQWSRDTDNCEKLLIDAVAETLDVSDADLVERHVYKRLERDPLHARVEMSVWLR